MLHSCSFVGVQSVSLQELSGQKTPGLSIFEPLVCWQWKVVSFFLAVLVEHTTAIAEVTTGQRTDKNFSCSLALH